VSNISAPSSPPMLAVDGLTMPFLSEFDPDTLGEGSLDPLGLASTAEALAEFIAPQVTARMSRIRFLTAIALATLVSEALDDVIPGDAISSADLVFEWHVVEALARDKSLPVAATRAVPGIGKARGMLAFDASGHLDARSYLKTPRVFGFHGVYRRLARSLGIVQGEALHERGVELARVWEREQNLRGFVDGRPGTSGGRFASRLTRAIRSSLLKGRVIEKPTGSLLRELAKSLRPDGAGKEERDLLRLWLFDIQEPRRREMLEHLLERPESEPEERTLDSVACVATPLLAEPIHAISAYERVTRLLDWGFQSLLHASTMQGTVPLPVEHAAKSPVFAQIATELPGAVAAASDRLAALGLEERLAPIVGQFGEKLTTVSLVNALLHSHRAVQEAKGKFMWVAVDERGFRVRRADYRRPDEPTYRDDYLHPYRVAAMRAFLDDLGNQP
jgi:hypothetical protein